MLVGLTGKARSGKDTVGDYLFQEHGFVRYAFADPLKAAASEAFGIPLSQLYGEHGYDREVVLPEWGMSCRQILQDFGKAMRDVFVDDFWIQRATMELSLLSEMNTVITDVRYPNEVQFIREREGIILGIQRPASSVEVRAHDSEKMADELEQVADIVLTNDGTIEDLENLVCKSLF